MAGIMLVVDHSLFRQALAVVLDGELGMRVIARAESVAEARERAPALGDTVSTAILSFDLHNGDTTEDLAELRLTLPEAEILVLTASTKPDAVARAREAGASVVLRKAATQAEILAALRDLTGSS